MTDSPIDDYIRAVARHLKLRGPARRQALADLLETLTEQAVATSERAAVSAAGPASEYANNLDEQFGTAQSAHQTIWGIPNSFTKGIGCRMAATFNPADERLIIPRVFGAGWTLNMGAVAVRLGLLNPDDVDDEVLTQAMEHLPLTRAIAGIPVLLGLAAGLLLMTRHETVAAVTGKSQTTNVVAGLAGPMVAAALLVSAGDDDLPAGQRLTMPAIAASLGCLMSGASTQLALRPMGRGLALTGTVVAVPVNLLLSYLPVRAALRQQWRKLGDR